MQTMIQQIEAQMKNIRSGKIDPATLLTTLETMKAVLADGTVVDPVSRAIGALTMSEQEAMQALLQEIPDDGGLVVASKVADKACVTRSVIVNALRKFESAGVIATRSLGMKGTHVKALVPDGIRRMRIAVA
jgi:GTP-sensing pleiotropic transcriptional regulator CodY